MRKCKYCYREQGRLNGLKDETTFSYSSQGLNPGAINCCQPRYQSGHGGHCLGNLCAAILIYCRTILIPVP